MVAKGRKKPSKAYALRIVMVQDPLLASPWPVRDPY